MYQIKDFTYLLGLSGFSDTLLTNHFALYEGYVNNVNKLNDAIVKLENEGQFGSLEYAEMNRRFGWEWNGMRLHELYFGNLTKEGAILGENSLKNAIEKEWGSLDLWQKDFCAMGAMRGIGWVILSFDTLSGKMYNVWINEHNTGHLAGTNPILVMDVFEHAYMSDYGLKRAEYISAFMRSVDWKAAESRFLGEKKAM